MIKTSVIITNYNYARYVGRCVRSCLNQTMPSEDYEVIVVDDGSTDNSRKVIESLGDTVKPVFIGHSGVAYASNVGIKKALGTFVIRVDADDYINQNMLLFMTEILVWNPDIGFVYCDHFLVNEKEEKQERIRLNTVGTLYNHGAGIMFRKSNLEAIGLYDVTLENCEDYDLITRYLKNFDGYYLKLPLYRYRKHGDSLSSDKVTRERWRKYVTNKHNPEVSG
jgi:glycosyltransferase involved in cell wall biosynthesis